MSCFGSRSKSTEQKRPTCATSSVINGLSWCLCMATNEKTLKAYIFDQTINAKSSNGGRNAEASSVV